MKKDLKDCTFIIPLQIESNDRLRNIIAVICYILGNFDTKIIVKEVDEESHFENLALPQIKDFLDDNISGLTHIFLKLDKSKNIFHRTKYLNEMIQISDTEIVVNYDCDVLLPISTYFESRNLIINDNYDMIYPYGFGNWQKMIFADDQLVSKFLSNDFEFSFLEGKSQIQDAKYGHVQFFKKSSYIEGGMENENFKSWGPEDFERHFRFSTLGYKVGRVDSFVYHLEHSRGFNSYYNNPYHENNVKLWDHIKNMNEEQLRDYYNKQNYLQKYQKEVFSNE